MGEWQNWVGRTERRTDRADAALAARWLATFDRAAPADGTMPQGFHWCLCTPDAPTSTLGADGHPLRDDSPDSFLPPVPLPRRMWAASKMEFVAPIMLGAAIERRSSVAAITEKQGASGALVFVEVAHDTLSDGAVAVREVQSVVYRAAAAAGSPLVPPPLGRALSIRGRGPRTAR
ncbi:MaoC family dehydratase N-terminal domain-containing protein [Novosphingobium sp. THN1]|uniref:FAS1-like dehydratase domain-containing protein n=1 Tax=Novosphingobium sp. THN1 TaxID=1016987 RepID=UPI0026D8E17B